MDYAITDTREVFKHAKWIWPLDPGHDTVNYLMQARHVFDLPAAPRKCIIRVSADSRYKLFANRRYIASGPARGFQSHWPYDELDIAPYLKRGRNVIAASVLCFGRGTFQHISKDSGGLILIGKAGAVDFSTGGNWRVRRDRGYLRHTTQVSLQVGFEEFYDARLEDGSWVEASYEEHDKPVAFDDPGRIDDRWRAPVVRPAGCMPWPAVEPRMIPMLHEEVILPRTLVAECKGKSYPSWREIDNVTEGYLRDKHDWENSAKALDGNVIRAPTTPKGFFRSYLVDFGIEVLGSIILEAAGAAGGEVVDTQISESLTGLAPNVLTPYLNRMAFGNRLTLRKGTTHREQFDRWGFRYAVLTIRENPRPITLRMSLRTALYPLNIKASFRSSDKTLNDVYRISVRAQECCMTDSYIDCPWREQAQWWGDARIQAANTLHLSADPRMLARGIRQIGAQSVPNGLTYAVAPGMAHTCVLPDYTLTWVMTVWDHYYQTGDKALIREQVDRMRWALSYFEGVTAPNGLLPYDERYWLFLDWADIFKEGYATVYNMLYFMTLETAARLFALTGEKKDAAKSARCAEALRAAIMKRLFDTKRCAFYGGLDSKGRPMKSDTPHAYALAVIAGICPERDAEFVTERLLPVVRGEFPEKDKPSNPVFAPNTTPSPFFMYYVFEALKMHGRKAEVVDCILRWWGRFIDWGVTCTPELWERPDGGASACHAWSAHPIVHLHNIILGVTQNALAWKSIRFEPVFTGKSASGKVATPLGEVGVAWERADRAAEVRLAVPKGMTARVILPGVKRTVKSGRHRWRVTF